MLFGSNLVWCLFEIWRTLALSREYWVVNVAKIRELEEARKMRTFCCCCLLKKKFWNTNAPWGWPPQMVLYWSWSHFRKTLHFLLPFKYFWLEHMPRTSLFIWNWLASRCSAFSSSYSDVGTGWDVNLPSARLGYEIPAQKVHQKSYRLAWKTGHSMAPDSCHETTACLA